MEWKANIINTKNVYISNKETPLKHFMNNEKLQTIIKNNIKIQTDDIRGLMNTTK